MARNFFTIVAIALSATPLSSQAQAGVGAQQTPPEVESQAQSVEAKFNSVLAQECDAKICTPVGCEVLGFRTLDEKQTSSLPGLDEGDEVAQSLQYKLSSMRCEFAYEPSLSDEAVSTLRKRISDKIRAVGISLTIQGRRLSASHPALSNSPTSSVREQDSLSRSLAGVLPGLLLAFAITACLLALIWAARRLGKSEPLALETDANPNSTDNPPLKSQPEVTDREVLNKKELLIETFSANPKLAATAFEPIVASNDVDEICRVLKHFGPDSLSSFAHEASHRDLFAKVHKRYGETTLDEDNRATMIFLEKVERLISLAQLGRPETPVREELEFLRDLAPDEFAQLVSGFESEELMTILSFVPTHLRAHFLRTRDPLFIEAYTKHVLKYPRLSEKLLRGLTQKLQEQYAKRHSEIRKVSRDQLSQMEHLLNTLGSSQRKLLYASLRKENPTLFERLSSEVLLDRALVRAPESVLNDLFLTLMPDEAAAYLQSNPDCNAILAKLKAPLAQSIRARMARNGNGNGLNFLDSDDPAAEQARLKVNEILKQKAALGEVNLRRINESVMDSI